VTTRERLFAQRTSDGAFWRTERYRNDFELFCVPSKYMSHKHLESPKNPQTAYNFCSRFD